MNISDRIKGMDVSTLVEEEACGAKFFDEGVERDLFDILEKYGVNSVRLRLWNDPYGERIPGTEARYPYGAGTNDFETFVRLAKRAKAHNMSVLLDFHYSDFWADPGKQFLPKAWREYSAEKLVEAVYAFTRETLIRLKELDLLPGLVQVGNELTAGCCWPYGRRDYNTDGSRSYFNPVLKDIITAGIAAVREVSPGSVIMLHLDNGGNNRLYRDWFDGYFASQGAGYALKFREKLKDCGKRADDFDVIGLSYYPFWHGKLKALEDNMTDIAARYGKELVIAEVSMGHTMEDYRRYELAAGAATGKACTEETAELKGMATREELTRNLDYPMTIEGQESFMRHLNTIISGIGDNLGRGYYYWEPAWIPVPGCGWATQASLEYIHDKGPCGNEWANQALFDYDGNALPALKV